MSKYYSSSIAFGANQTKTEQVVVSTTKIGNVTTDAVSGALTVDEVPTLDSLNPVSSDGVARAVIQAGAELPTRGSTDTGKVLTVKNSAGDLEWDEPADGLPDMTGNAGKLLGAVDNGGTTEAQWVNPPESYPSVTGNAGKVLTVNNGATGVEWAATQLPEEKSLASTNNTISITEGATTVSIDVANPLPSTLGTAGQVLTVNSGATGVEWADPSGDAVMITLNAAPSTQAEKQALFDQVTSAVDAGQEVLLRLNINSGFSGSFTLQLARVIGSTDAGSCEYHFNCVDEGNFSSPTSQYSVYQKVVVIMFDGNDYYDYVGYEIPLATANAVSFNPFN